MKLIKTLEYLGLAISILVGLGACFLHYSPSFLEHTEPYKFFKFVS